MKDNGVRGFLTQLPHGMEMLLEKAAGPGDGGPIRPDGVRWVVRTGTKVDVGMWFRKGRVWACVVPGRLLLLAVGKKPHVQGISFEDLRESCYNHVTAEVVLAPVENVMAGRLRLSPIDGKRLLEHICSEEKNNA